MKNIQNILTHLEAIDYNKEPEVYIPQDATLYGEQGIYNLAAAMPYYIRKVYYDGAHDTIRRFLKLQFKEVEDGVFSRPSNEVALILTSKCNLACDNCNMLSNHKQTTSVMSDDVLDNFIVNYTLDKSDTMIRLTGGEPTTLGVKLLTSITKLHDAGFEYITVLTNGIIPMDLPCYVAIENSSKSTGIQPEFNEVYKAPQDYGLFAPHTYKAGCLQADVCGITYTSDAKYFPCPTGASIYKSLYAAGIVPEFDATTIEDAKANRHKFFATMCKMCGMFNKGGYHGVSKHWFKRTTTEERSKSWENIKLI